MLRPPSGWASVLVLTLMLLSVAWLVQALEWTPGLGVLTPIVLLAIVTGTVFGRMLWLPATLAHGWSAVVGVAATLFLGTFALRDYVLNPLELASRSRLDQMTEVRDWFMDWLSLAVHGSNVPAETAQFVFVLWMAMLLWLVSYIAAWFLTRYVNWWGAILPAGFALIANVYHAPETYLSYLAFFVLCALVLGVQTHLTLQLDEWRHNRVNHSPDIGFALMRDGLMVSVVVIGLGWLAPAQLGQSRIRSALVELTGQRSRVGTEFNRLFPSLNYPARGSGSSFGTELPLGGSISLGDQPVFDGKLQGMPAGVEPRYWRLAVFDQYTGAGWRRNSDVVVPTSGLDQPLTVPSSATTPVTQTITPLRSDASQLAAVPQPSAFSPQVRVELAGGPAVWDVLAASSAGDLSVGEPFQVVSHASHATLEALRGAAVRDPEWVVDRYLRLPPGVPERVVETAIEVTRPGANRYDKADAIEDFLRREYEYSDVIDQPPEGRDLADWFLFEERRGYCDYYSTAFVVLARSVGIPARLAAGYAAGRYVPEKEVYRQTESDAHTWPEVYFGNYGWIEFEPTASESHPEITRPVAPGSDVLDREPRPTPDREQPLSDDDLLPPRDPLDSLPFGATGPGGTVDMALLLPVLLALAILGTAATVSYVVWQRPLRGLSAAEGAFARLVRAAGWLGLKLRTGDTPFEFGERVSVAVPEGRDQIRTITDCYVRERFGRSVGDAGTIAPQAAWEGLRGMLVRAGARLGIVRLRAAIDDADGVEHPDAG